MSTYVLRGTSGYADEPNDENPLSRFSSDVCWEIGYDEHGFRARLVDDDPDEDLTPDEAAEPIFEVYGCADLGALNRELAAMAMWVPESIAAALEDEQRRHLVGVGSLRQRR